MNQIIDRYLYSVLRNVGEPSLSSNVRIVELSSNRRANPVLYPFARNASKMSNSLEKYVLIWIVAQVLNI